MLTLVGEPLTTLSRGVKDIQRSLIVDLADFEFETGFSLQTNI